MNNLFKSKEILSIISKSLKEFDKSLKNKTVMFIVENKNRKIEKVEVFFPKSGFYHLTGLIVKNREGKKLNSFEFYNGIKDNIITPSKYIIKNKDNTTDLKLNVLPQLMKIDKIANMIGDFANLNLVLQTEKIAGNINACMGFVKDTKSRLYVPNTVLQKDIRTITNNTNKIIAILKKEKKDNLYQNITYLKSNYEIYNILRNQKINEVIDLKNIYSTDKLIDKKIYNFLYKNNLK